MFFLFSIFLLSLLVHLGAIVAAKQIQSNPDQYPLEKLLQAPQGETHWVAREDGTKLYAVAAGNGPTIVLAHAFGLEHSEWTAVWEALVAAGYHVIAFDQRGHGRSTFGKTGLGSSQMASDYKAILEYFDVQRATLVTHSMGGFLAIVFMLTFPKVARQRLSYTILISTLAGNVYKGAPQNRFQIPMLKWGLMQKIAGSAIYSWLLGTTFTGSKPSPAIIAAANKAFAKVPTNLAPVLEMLSENYYPRLHEIDIPCTVVCGTADKSTPKWHSETMGRDIPNAQNIWLAGKGHLLNWEAAEEIVELVKSVQPQNDAPSNLQDSTELTLAEAI